MGNETTEDGDRLALRNEAVGNLLKYLEDQIFYVFFMI